MRKLLEIAGCTLVLWLGVSGATDKPAKSAYSVAGRIPLSGDEGWDYCSVDDASGRLFVTHGSGVNVIDLKRREEVTRIPNLKGVHGVCFAPELNRGFISDGKDTAVIIFDLATLVVTGKVHVTGLNPDAIIYDAFSKSVFVFNGKSADATVIDAQSGAVTATIPLGGKPEFAAVDGKGLLYVNLEDAGVVAVVNTRSHGVEQKWPVAPAEEPCSMAFDAVSGRLFIGCRSKALVVMEAATGRIITSLPIGDHVDAVCYDGAAGMVLCSNGEGTVTVIEAGKGEEYEVVQTVATQKGAKTMALDRTTHRLYLPAAEYGPAPAPREQEPKLKASVKQGTFMVLELAPIGG